MDDEKLKLANSLSKNLLQAELILDRWKRALDFSPQNKVHMYIKNAADHGADFYEYLETAPISFVVVKALSINHWEKVVADLKTEFENL